MNPKLSGYAQLYGEFKYNAITLAPPGTHIIVHEKPTVRGTWASHGVKGWYIGPSMEHYRCYHVYITKTGGERDSAIRESTSRSILLDPLYFLVFEKKVFLPSLSFFGFMRTMFSSLLSTICIYNTITGYSTPFKVFYKVICSVARG